MFTTKEELKPHMKVANLDVITGSDDVIVTSAIDGAIAEAMGYLSDFDTDTIFAATAENRNALLLTFVKDIAVWHLVVLSNYNADIKLRENRYNRAVKWLEGVQQKAIVPNLPAKVDAEGATILPIKFGSNEQRIQHF